MGYSVGFKKAAVKKLLLSNGASISRMATKLGVSATALRNWRIEFETINDGDDMKKSKRLQDWSAEEKFQAIIETADLNEEDVGGYCRRNGLNADQLKEWRETCLDGMHKGPKVDPEKKDLKKEVMVLKRELRRKEKALAETAVLLVLKKEAAEIWGEVDKDE